jgi:hypothetical protein
VNVLIPSEMSKAFIERAQYVRDEKGAIWPERVRKGGTFGRIGVWACRRVAVKSSGRAGLYPAVAALVGPPHARVPRPRDKVQPYRRWAPHADTPTRSPHFPRPSVLPGKPAASK